MTPLTHRLRGHRPRRITRYIYFDTRPRGIEHGLQQHLLVCSCGERWVQVTNPLTGKQRWL